MAQLNVNEPILEISSDLIGEIFKIGQTGEIWWKKDGGEFVQAKVDEDLVLAFAYVVFKLSNHLTPEMKEKLETHYLT